MTVKKITALLLSSIMFFTGCSMKDIPPADEESTGEQSQQIERVVDTNSEEYVNSLGFKSLSDPNFHRYIEDSVYSELLEQVNTDIYFVENVQTVYISQEYIEESNYNSLENIYFGYTLSELEEQFGEQRYVFTTDESGQTVLKTWEDDEGEREEFSYANVLKDVAIGGGVVLVCVTVSAIAGEMGAAPISVIFAEAAKTAAENALSSGFISGVSAGIIEGFESKDFGKAFEAAAQAAGEKFKWGAISGALNSGKESFSNLLGEKKENGLKVDKAAEIQKESKYPLDVIKEFTNTEQYDMCKELGLKAEMINGKTALVRDIDINYVDKETGMTNLERMKKGLAAVDENGNPYELHHIGQHENSTLAILTQEEHRLNGNFNIWHEYKEESEIDRKEFDKTRKAFWTDMFFKYV